MHVESGLAGARHRVDHGSVAGFGRRECGVCFAAAFAYLAVGASPAHFWLDSGEIGAAGHELGVVHPPGVPGFVMLLRLSTLLPVGSLGFRMALASAALGAVAVTLVGLVAARHGASRPLAFGAAAWVLAGLTFVRQGRVVEIYSLSAALMMIVLAGLDPAVRERDRLPWRLAATAAATWAALGFGDLRIALVPLVALSWWFARRRREAWWRWALPVTVMAALVVLTLPLAAASDPWASWGEPDTAGRLWDHLQARSIRASFADEILPASVAMWGLNAGDALGRIAEDLGAPGLVLAAASLGLAWTRRGEGERAIAGAMTWLVAIEALYIVGVNPMGGADRQTGLVLGPLAALLVARELSLRLAGKDRLAWAVLPLAGAVAIGPPAMRSVPDLAVTRSWAPHAWTRGALAMLPPRSLLLTQSDDLAAGWATARQIEGARPDLVVAPGQHLHKRPPAAADERRRAPWDAAAPGRDERERLELAIAAYPGPVALETPAAGLYKALPWWSPRGGVPLSVAGPGAQWVPPRPSAREEIQHWLPRMRTDVDRKRLAVALSNRARGIVKVEGDVRTAGAMLELVVEHVDDGHASTLVTLGALRDRVGDTPGAIALTRRALTLEPGRSAALTNLALYLARDPATRDEALQTAERAAALRPWRRAVWARLAQVRELAGDVEGAAQARARAEAATSP